MLLIKYSTAGTAKRPYALHDGWSLEANRMADSTLVNPPEPPLLTRSTRRKMRAKTSFSSSEPNAISVGDTSICDRTAANDRIARVVSKEVYAGRRKKEDDMLGT